MRSFTSLYILAFLFLFGSCVGTVQETATPNSGQVTNPPTQFTFTGITSARGISHNKIEVEFFPAGGADIEYKLYINDSSQATNINPKTLYSTTGGKLLYTISNLETDREYKLKIRAFKPKTNAESKGELEAFARTFDNVVSNFTGVSKVSLVPGMTESAIQVDWIAVPMSGVFSAGPYDTAYYETTVISEIGGPANMNNPHYLGSDKIPDQMPKGVRASPGNNPSSTIISGLQPNTRYYVQVRAINQLYQNFDDDPLLTTIPVAKELNTKYLSIKTDSAGGLFDFRQDNVVLSNAAGLDAFDKINVFWQPGSGSFTGYKIFFRKYVEAGDPFVDDKLTESMLNSLIPSAISVSPALSSKQITGLDNYGFYQVKVALCKNVTCPVLSSDPNAAIISDLKTIQVKPTLAPFSGVNAIEPPGQYSARNLVNLKFDAPIISAGYANQLEIYCVNPSNHSQMFLFNANDPLTGTGIAACDGLSLLNSPPALGSYTSQKVSGVIADGAHQYCFAATPAIVGYGSPVRLGVGERIVRCTYPEVIPPTIAQFPGVKNTCSISATTGHLEWNLPNGGIYSGFKVFWKEKSTSAKFSFASAISGDPAYSMSPSLTAADVSYDILNLVPGKTYQMGVLAEVDMDAPAADLYSEFNLKILECNVPLPIATFKGFTRIFSVGPKNDGRVPNDPSTKFSPASAKIFEAINDDGIPFEVTMENATAANMTLNFAPPPGRDAGNSFSSTFDGAPEGVLGHAMSRDGIVSLAWEEVEMSFPEANTMFLANIPAEPALRSNRLYGYRVYRSHDNKLSWKEVTTLNGPVYSKSVSFRKRTNASTVTKRMAFFTDYSVKAIDEIHDSTIAHDVARARKYYYRIVPVFDGHPLAYSRANDHVVQVTLPPANMALVHRWMANRSHCMEMDKDYDITRNYSCEYNGIGATGKSIPHRIDDTVFDQKGDLLVDRNELGCRYTRGERVPDPELGASVFDRGSNRRLATDYSYFPLFKGFRTVAEVEDTSTPFRGCAGVTSHTYGNGTASDYSPSFNADYQHLLQGDCIGRHQETIAMSSCTAQQFADAVFTPINLIAPGVQLQAAENCSISTSMNPTYLTTKYTGSYAPNFQIHSEFLAVYYNTLSSGLSANNYGLPIEGPTTTLTGSTRMEREYANGAGFSQCSINLAAIDGSGYLRPRWLSANEFADNRVNFKGDTKALAGMTVDQLTEVQPNPAGLRTFYNGAEGDGTTAAWKLPSTTLRNSPRYRGTTRVGRIFSSNSAKLPPIGRMPSDLAQRLCATYYVQTGVASDTGNFSPDSIAVPKRPLRRPESVTAAAWPDTYDTAKVAALESSNSVGSCNSSTKGVNGTQVNKGEVIRNNFSFSSTTTGGIPLVTGSSHQNGHKGNAESVHTSGCVSKYGVQDMVGNVLEHNSERIFCDYSQDTSNIGPTNASWGGGTEAINVEADNDIPSIPFFNLNEQRYNWAVLRSGADSANTSSSFQVRFRDGTTTRSDFKPWVKISTDSGYCSFVDTDPSRRTDPTNLFRNLDGVFSNLNLPGGALNTSMIATTQFDQKAVLRWRSGDGRFMDFGPNGFGASLNNGNTLALSGSDITTTDYSKQSKYFNPVVGFPLICNDVACDDENITKTNDNVAFTTDDLTANVKPADQQPTIWDFPVGNSQIKHLGISDFAYHADGYESVTAVHGRDFTSISNILMAVEVDDPFTMGNPTYISKSFPLDWVDGTTIQYYKIRWDVERGTIFGLTSGGKANEPRTGRYTASISRTYPNMTSGTEDFNSGTRCAVMINEEN